MSSPVLPSTFAAHPELPPGVEPSRSRLPPWRPWMAWAGLLAGLIAAVMGAAVVGAIAALLGYDWSDHPPGVTIAATVVQDAGLVGTAVLFARMAGSATRRDFGLAPTRLLSAIGWIAVAMASFYVITVVWVAIVGAESTDERVLDDLGVDESTLALICGAALVTIVAPIAEELFFRGFFFTALRNWRGIWPAAILTGLVFGAIHAGSADIAFLLPLGVFGVALCLLYVKTGSLYPCIALHCLNNALAFGVAKDWSWQIAVLLAASLAVLALLAGAVARWPAVRAALPSR